MTRRAAAGFARLLPLLLIAAAVLVLTGATLLAACGGSTDAPTSEPTAGATATAPASGTAEPTVEPSATPSPEPAQTTLHLYFLRGEMLGVADRHVAQTTMPATAAMKALLAGPTADEQAAGLGTSIPAGTRLLGLSIRNGTATVDLSDEFGTGGGSLSVTTRVAEVVYTLTRFPTVKAVSFLMGGQPVEALSGEGLVLDAPQRRSDFADLQPNIFVESPGVGAVLSSPFVLSGTARVFEGTFQARLVDSSGRRIVNVIMTASRGAPGRGTFSKEVPFSTSAKRGTLIVFDESMEDGSRQDEVEIPVTFATD